jgi:hypothetical protein
MLRVTQVEPLDDHHLRLSFSDGVVGDVDCSFLLHGSLGESLHDANYFRQARVDNEAGTVVWPNGLDPAPELLHKLATARARDSAAR